MALVHAVGIYDNSRDTTNWSDFGDARRHGRRQPPWRSPHRGHWLPEPGTTVGPGTPAAVPGARLRRFTLVATGDVLPHHEIIQQAGGDARGDGHDFRPMFAGVKPVVSGADLAICHMETIYGADGGRSPATPASSPRPRSPPPSKDAGYDSCSTASNHTLDDGADGVQPHPGRHGRGRPAARGLGPLRRRGQPARAAAGRPRQGRPALVHLRHQRHPAARQGRPGRSTSSTARRSSPTPARPGGRARTWWSSACTGAPNGSTPPDEQQLTLARTLTASRTDGRPTST